MEKISAVIIDSNPTTNEILKQYAQDNSKISEFHQFLKLEDGYSFICKEHANLIFIDVAFGIDIVSEVTSKISKEKPNAKIVLIGNDFSADTLIKAMKIGAKETLIKPVIKSDFDSLITELVNQINYNSDFINSKIISVFSNKGGVGKTTLAANLAIETAAISNKPTVLVDFNSQFGDVSTFLDIKTDFGISYLLQNKNKLNKEFLLSHLPQYQDYPLHVLTDSFYLNDIKELSLEDIQDIIDALKLTFSYIIIDLTNILDLKTIKILDNSDDILFPILANMPNLRNCQRCLDFFTRIGYSDDKIKLILNRYSQNDEVKIESIEKTLNKKIYQRVINNYFITTAAINRGVCISGIDTNSDIAKSIQSLSYNLLELQETQEV